MSSIQAIFDEMAQRGVTARVDGETLRLKPREALDDDLLARIKEHKQEIIRALETIPPDSRPGRTGRLRTCASSCYEIEPGRWIHHPWDGCTTPMPPAKDAEAVEQNLVALRRRKEMPLRHLSIGRVHGVSRKRENARVAAMKRAKPEPRSLFVTDECAVVVEVKAAGA